MWTFRKITELLDNQYRSQTVELLVSDFAIVSFKSVSHRYEKTGASSYKPAKLSENVET
jgi:hypothetical protein